jgi:hypothetical protein
MTEEVDVLGIGERLFERIFTHERFGDVSDEVCNRMLIYLFTNVM